MSLRHIGHGPGDAQPRPARHRAMQQRSWHVPGGIQPALCLAKRSISRTRTTTTTHRENCIGILPLADTNRIGWTSALCQEPPLPGCIYGGYGIKAAVRKGRAGETISKKVFLPRWNLSNSYPICFSPAFKRRTKQERCKAELRLPSLDARSTSRVTPSQSSSTAQSGEVLQGKCPQGQESRAADALREPQQCLECALGDAETLQAQAMLVCKRSYVCNMQEAGAAAQATRESNRPREEWTWRRRDSGLVHHAAGPREICHSGCQGTGHMHSEGTFCQQVLESS